MNTTPPPPSGDPLGYDPAEGLAMLKQSQDQVVAAHQLDFGPWWYSAIFGAVHPALFAWVLGDGGLIVSITALLAIAGFSTVAIFDRPRSGIHMGWLATGNRNRRGMTITFLMNFVLIFGWLQAMNWFDDQESLSLLGFALIGWAATTAVFLVVRAAMHRERRKVLGI